MENTNSKIITFSFMTTAVLAGIVVGVLLDTVAAVATGGLARALSSDLVRQGVPVVLGFALYLALQFNAKVGVWADEVTSEIRRVVWPSRKDTTAMTIMVCIMLIISGIVIGLMDVFSGTVVDWLLHLNFRGIF